MQTADDMRTLMGARAEGKSDEELLRYRDSLRTLAQVVWRAFRARSASSSAGSEDTTPSSTSKARA